MRSEYPEFRDWSIAAVRLLQGVVELEDGRVWGLLLANRSQIEQYVARLGLQLIVDESEGLAYLRQFSDESMPPGYDALPKLFRATRLSYGQTVLCVLLREALRRFEETEVHEDRCRVEESELWERWRGFFPAPDDDVRQLRDLQAALRKLEDLGLVRSLGGEPAHWEVRRILKARLTADELEHLHRQLQAAVAVRDGGRQPQTAAERPR